MTEAPYDREATATLTASRWRLWLARALGRRRIEYDGQCLVELAEWRGQRYLLNFAESPQDTRRRT